MAVCYVLSAISSLKMNNIVDMLLFGVTNEPKMHN